MDRKYVIVIVLLVTVVRVMEAADAMKFLAGGFLKVLDECKKEVRAHLGGQTFQLGLDDHLITDIYHYWKLDFDLLRRETGCAIVCMSRKLDLLDPSGRLRQDNAKEFAKKHGAADDLASKMVSIIHDCEEKHTSVADECVRILEVAKCFRQRLHDLDWDPKVDSIYTDVMTEP